MNKFINTFNNKKLLASLILFALTVLLAGASTYTWFTASVVSSGKIQVGTFKLDINDEAKAVIDLGKIQPGEASAEKVIYFSNAGNLDMVLMGNLNLLSEDKVFSNGVGDINAYKIIAKIYKNNDMDPNNLIYETADSKLGEPIVTFNSGLNNNLDSQGGVPKVFASNEKLVCKFRFLLDSSLANNTHQGDDVNIIFEVKARQNIAGAVYSE